MILHVDMDAFYAAVEQRERPELAGRPVVVGGTPEQRGVVAAANYEARRYGVHSAMPSATARRLCPQAVFLPARHAFYGQVSRQIREILHRYTPLVEPLALDEAFLDVRGSVRLFGPPAEIGRQIKQQIRSQLDLVASVGVAPNKFLAKLASDADKPDGFVVIQPHEVRAFLDPLPVGRLWGVGRVGQQRLARGGVRTIGQLRKLSAEALRSLLGAEGEQLGRLAEGRDDRPVVPDQEARSISHETTFAQDIDDLNVLRGWLMELTEQVARRLRRHDLRARTVHLKVRFSDFRTITRAHTLPAPTNLTSQLWETAALLLDHRLPAGHLPVRLLGVGTSGLARHAAVQGELFDGPQLKKQQQLDAAADRINERFGSGALRRGAGLREGGKRRT